MKMLDNAFMNMDGSKRFGRMLMWAAGIFGKFNDGDAAWEMEKMHLWGTNFCRACRMIFLYAPVIILLHLFVIVEAVYVFGVLPAKFWGTGGLSKFWIMIILIPVFMVLIRYVVAPTGSKVVTEYKGWRRESRENKTEKVDTGPSVFSILWHWVKTNKKKICPMVTFKKGE